jgi:type II secretory ATPase GspE/PulE/Tfp pilus assembly ATPase PilB-like protein
MDPKESARLGEILVDQETLIGNLYRSYAGKFPNLREFWERLADDEKGHAQVMEKVRFALLDGKVRVAGPSLDLRLVEEQYEMLRSLLRGRYADPGTSDKALQFALTLEQSLLESKIFESLQSAAPEIQQILAAVGNKTNSHYTQVRELVYRHKVFQQLLETGHVSIPILQQAIAAAHNEGSSVPHILSKRFGVPKEEVLSALSAFFRVPSFAPNRDPPLPIDLSAKLSPLAEAFRKEGFVPVGQEGRSLLVALEDPNDVLLRDRIVALLPQWKVEFRVALREDVLVAQDLFFGGSAARETSTLRDVLETLEGDQRLAPAGAGGPEAEEEADESAVAQVVNRMIQEAHARGASDIHLEPSLRGGMAIRYRIDGVLFPVHTIPTALGRAVLSRLKIMADLDIAEKRKAQSGKIQMRRWAPLDLELRIETFSTVASTEDAVLRILAASKALKLADLSMSHGNLARFQALIDSPYGLVLCVGPTGSGKTTTLHSALNQLSGPGVKIMTAEDPVEITQPGLRQVQVNPKAGITFASALRSFLRADPDIVMIGEMRDEETASAAIEASLTGHLVLSTLHTNNAPDTITRLLEMGIDQYAFADSLLGILAQRLLRRLCPECRKPVGDPGRMLEEIRREYGPRFEGLMASVPRPALFEADPKGCDACRQTGYKGRLGIHELLVVSDRIREIIYRRGRVTEIREAALEQGMRTLKEDGIEKVLAGATTIEEVLATAGR